MGLEEKDFPSNSRRTREGLTEETKEAVKGREVPVEPISTKTQMRKRNEAQKFFSRLVTFDIAEIKDYVVFEVIEPTIRTAVTETIYTITSMIFNGGDARGYKRRSGGSRYDYTRHSRVSRPRDRFDSREREYERDRDRDRHDRREPRTDWSDLAYIEFDNIDGAFDAIDRLERIIDKYSEASVAQYCEMTKQPVVSTDYNYGWKELDRATVPKRRGSRYYIDLPEPVYLGE